MIINETELNELHFFKGEKVNVKIEKIIESEETVSSNYRIIEKLSYKIDKKYYYYYIIQCLSCGKLKKINCNDWKNQKIRRCINCLSQQKRESHIGFENNTYRIIGINLEKTNKNKKRIYYDVICKNCGAHLILRWDCIVSDTKNGKCCKCKGNNKKASSSSIINILYNRYKQNALSRGFDFNLSHQDFENLISQNCYYCGNAPKEQKSLQRYNHTNEAVYVNGVDRIDSSKGYSLENCVPCCEICNRMKLDYSYNFFYNHITKIYNYYHRSLTTISKESTSQANGDGSGGYPEKDNDIV